MKKIFGFIIATLMLAFTGISQERETVLSITQERHEIGWYETQLSLWEKYVTEHSDDAPAWYNYYSAARAIKNLNWETPEEYKKWSKECNTISDNAYKAVPNSFEANHMVWWDSGNDESKREFLMRAHEIAPNDTRAFDDLMIFYELNQNQEKFHELCVKIYESGELPASILNWGYNVLAELDENAIVFANGDNDTYALWLVQEVKGFRKDVTVMNTYLIKVEDYQKKLFQKIGLPEFDGPKEELYNAIFMNEKGIPVYVDVCGIKFFEEYSVLEDLYLTGLAYKYSKKDLDNTSLIRRNYEKRYLLDYLTEQFASHPSDGVADNFLSLYLPSMIKLYSHYKNSEETMKMDEINTLIQKISKRTGKEGLVEQLLKDC